MNNYKRITMREFAGVTGDATYNRLAELEDKIESGELVDRNEYLDRLMTAKDISGMTDKELEFFAKHNARVRENAEHRAEVAERALATVCEEVLHARYPVEYVTVSVVNDFIQHILKEAEKELTED